MKGLIRRHPWLAVLAVVEMMLIATWVATANDLISEPTTTTMVLAVGPTTTSDLIPDPTTPTPSTAGPTGPTTQPTDPIAEPTTTTTTATSITEPSPTTIQSVTFSIEAEQFLVAVTNQLRVSEGLGELAVNADFNAYARAWASHMATTGQVQHSQISDLLGPWVIVGENIGNGSNIEQMWEGFAESSIHRSNLIEPAFSVIGIGVAVDGVGSLWVCQVFGGLVLPVALPESSILPFLPLNRPFQVTVPAASPLAALS